jgi:hypothetical protein
MPANIVNTKYQFHLVFTIVFKKKEERCEREGKYEISDFCCGVVEVVAFLGCYVVFVVSYQRFGTAYLSYIQRSSWTAWPLKM